MIRDKTTRLCMTGILVALGVFLPMVFHSVGISGSIFLPMHIPILVCGCICGARLGALCAVLTVLLSSIITGMPPIYPVGLYMIPELIVYAVSFGLLKKAKVNVYFALILSMILGRITLGVAQIILFGFMSQESFFAFLISAFVTALPGIVLQLAIIPFIITMFSKMGILKND